MKTTILTLILSGALAGSSFAQGYRPVEYRGEINQRHENQQDRIAAGIRDGQLNAREASHLESRVYRLSQITRFDRSRDDGRLTNGERFRINQQQNRISNSIYRDRHN